MNHHTKRIVLVATLTLLVSLISFGTVLFHALEDWTWIESFYFTIVTITTVGYGDIAPSNDTTRIVTALFILVGVGIGAGIISFYGSSVVKQGLRRGIVTGKQW